MRLALVAAAATWATLVIAGWGTGDAIAAAAGGLFLMCIFACVFAGRAEQRAVSELEGALEALGSRRREGLGEAVRRDWVPAELRTLVRSTHGEHLRTINDTMSLQNAGPRKTLDVLVVRAASCHLCDDALKALEELGTEFPLVIRKADAGSPEGMQVLGAKRPPMLPLVLLDGEVFSCGRLPRKKLRRFLERAQ